MKRSKIRRPSRELTFLVKLRTLPPKAQQDLLASLRQQCKKMRKSIMHHRSGSGINQPRVQKKNRASGRHRDRDFWLVTATGERHHL
jgi:hypothetical protein